MNRLANGWGQITLVEFFMPGDSGCKPLSRRLEQLATADRTLCLREVDIMNFETPVEGRETAPSGGAHLLITARRTGLLLWAAAWWIGIYVLLRFGFTTPIPSSVITL